MPNGSGGGPRAGASPDVERRGKLRILPEADAAKVDLASVARPRDLCPQQVYAWRRLFRDTAATAVAEAPLVFLPVEVSEASTRQAAPRVRRRPKAVEVTLVGGRRLRVDPDIDPDTLCRLVQALEQA